MIFPKDIQKQGFTLLEVLVAMVILLVGILATASLQGVITRNNTTGNVATQAVLMAQSQIDRIKSWSSIAELNDEFTSEDDVVPVDGDGDLIDGGGIFTIDYRFCDSLQDIIDGSYTPSTSFEGNMCDEAVSATDFADCGSAETCENGTSETCMAAVRVSWNRGGGGRGGGGCVVLQTLTQGDGV